MQSGDHNIWKESVLWVILKQDLLCHVWARDSHGHTVLRAGFLKKETSFLIIIGSIHFLILLVSQDMIPLTAFRVFVGS